MKGMNESEKIFISPVGASVSILKVAVFLSVTAPVAVSFR